MGMNQHKSMAMGPKARGACKPPAYKQGGSVCTCRKGGSASCNCSDCKMKCGGAVKKK